MQNKFRSKAVSSSGSQYSANGGRTTLRTHYPTNLTWKSDTIGQEGDASLSFIGLSGELVTLTLSEALFMLPLIDGRGQVRIIRVCGVAASNGHLSAEDLEAWTEWLATGN